LRDFKDEEANLKAGIDVSSKQADLEKRRKEEIKKVEKLCKKEQNEVESADQGKTPRNVWRG